jgi:hypothetical protein
MIFKIYAYLKIFIEKYFLIILGFILFSLYFWNRFLRSRTSKDLPFNLDVFKFFTIIYICLIFIYIVISLIFPRKQNKMIESIVNLLFTPLKEFDNYLKALSSIKPYYEEFMKFIISKLDYFIINTNVLFWIVWIIPRFILLFALYLDVFIFHKFHYKNMVILFGLLLFFNRYIKYSMKKYKEDLIIFYSKHIRNLVVPYRFGIHPSEYPENYDPDDEDNDFIPPTMFLPLEIFIKYQTESKVYNEETIEIVFILPTKALKTEMRAHEIGSKDPIIQAYHIEYKNKYKNTNFKENYEAECFISKQEDRYTNNAVEEIMQISLLLEYYSITSNQDKKIKLLKILIYINYLLCWLYVLIISILTLDIIELTNIIISTWANVVEPFSGIILYERL